MLKPLFAHMMTRYKTWDEQEVLALEKCEDALVHKKYRDVIKWASYLAKIQRQQELKRIDQEKDQND